MILRRETLKAVLPAVAERGDAAALQHVQVEPDGACVATDGHLLLKATATNRFDDADFPRNADRGMPPFVTSPTTAFLLPKLAVDRLIKATPTKTPIDILKAVQATVNGDQRPTVSATDLEAVVTVQAVDPADGHRFPDYARVLSAADQPVLRVTLAVDVLASLIQSAKAIGAKTATLAIPTGVEAQERDARTPDPALDHVFERMNG